MIDAYHLLRPGIALLLAVSLAACGGGSPDQGSAPTGEPVEAAGSQGDGSPESGNPFADTRWRLVELQSMSDAIGVVRPEEPSAYTMHLAGDGSVTMQLGCNTARGTWSASMGEDGESGRFTFGRLAVTRALCPPPRLDERVAREAEYVRSFVLRDGVLYLALMADGGIQAWESLPAGGPS